MSAPQSADEFAARFKANELITGYGVEGMAIHMPCPFCAAPDFIVYRLLGMQAAMENGATCRECHRTMRAVFDRRPHAVSFEFVQTGGEPPPPWAPQLRSIDVNVPAVSRREADEDGA